MRRHVIAAVILALSLGPATVSSASEAARALGAFDPAGELADARHDHTATLLPDGRVLIIAGDDYSEPGSLTSVEVWNPQAATFQPVGSVSQERSGHTATLLPDGRVLVIGGTCCKRNATVTEMWDPDTQSFTAAAPLVKGRIQGGHTATLLRDGRVLVIGGFDHRSRRLKLAEVWDPASETFREAGRLARVRAWHTATLLLDGRVLVIGGSPRADNRKLATAEVWDSASETFSPAGALARARVGHSATLLPDGRLLVVGGIDEMNRALASAETWDPASETFSPAGSLAKARLGQSATLLRDGRVLLVGGDGGGLGISVIRSAEIWDPATESFHPAGRLAVGRSSHTATLLPDGRVLVVGGSRDGQELDTAEVWDPTVEAPIPWPSTTLPGAWDVTAGHDRFVVVGFRGGRKPLAKAWTSTDGATWTRAPTTPDLKGAEMFHVVSVNDGFVAMGTDRKGRVAGWHSPDGLAWERAKVKRPGMRPFTAAVRSVVAGPGGLLAYADFVGQDFAGDRMWRSSDGRTWRPVPIPGQDPWPLGGLIATPGAYLLFDDGIWRSTDGRGWERVADEPVDGAFLGVASDDDGTVVAIGVRHVDPYPLATWITRDLETWELAWQSLDPESAAACKEEAALTIEESWMTWDGSQFAAHVDANRDGCGEWAVPDQLPLLVSSDGSAWVESTGPDGAPGYDEDLWVNGVASLGSATVVLGGIHGGPAMAWLMEPAAMGPPE